MADRYDVVVIGAGLIGSSIAWRLVTEGCTSVALLDVDLGGTYSASELSAGGVRALWSRTVDITLARVSIDFYQTIREEIGFRQRGYIWLHDAKTWEAVTTNAQLRNDGRLGVEFLDPEQAKSRVPDVDGFEGIEGATFSPKDGLMDSNLLKQYYRARANAGGATLLDNHMVTKVTKVSETELELEVAVFEVEDEDEYEQLLTTHTPPEGSTTKTIRCSTLVNAAGAWGGQVAALWNDKPPVTPYRRQISLAYSREVSLSRYGMIVFPSGLYCHPEAGHTLCGWRDPKEKPGFVFKYGAQTFFLREILPELMRRISGYEKTRHMGGWAGVVGETPDGSGLLGPVPGHGNIFEAIGFTGKGLAQSYAVGVCMADLILRGKFVRYDATDLSRSRFRSKARHKPDPLLL